MSKLRRRATAVVIRNSKLLLVRDKGKHRFSLPGGGVHAGEPSISAAARELYEETGLKATKIERLFVYSGVANRHAVFRVEADGKVQLRTELDKFIWWDGKQKVPVYPHVTNILRKIGWLR